MLVAFAAVLALGACASREHMSDGYARNSRAFFAKQHVYARAAKGSPVGLVSEESALIQGSYRKSLTKSTDDSTNKDSSSRVLLLRESPNAVTTGH
jgi:hypothetical protein